MYILVDACRETGGLSFNRTGALIGMDGLFEISDKFGIISIPLQVGLVNAYLNFIKTNNKLEIGDLFNSFNYYGKALGIGLWTTL